MKHRYGFTLLEILSVVTLLGILAAIVVPQFSSATDEARPAAMATTVVYVRKQISYHSAMGDVALSAEGFPESIHPSWFMFGRMPEHAWAGGPMIVKIMDKNPDEVYPKNKTFKPDPGEDNAWYNNTNGAFCVLVPDTFKDDAEIISAFNKANGVIITDVNQKQR
jgi:prepilin-type N-terminal cleavage/methylation domain-containing protein